MRYLEQPLLLAFHKNMKRNLLVEEHTGANYILFAGLLFVIAPLVVFGQTSGSTATSEVPVAPSNFYLDPSPPATVAHLNWTDNATNEDTFNIERKLSKNSSYSGLFLAQLGANTTAYTDTTALPGYDYDYRIQACRSGYGCSAYVYSGFFMSLPPGWGSTQATPITPVVPATSSANVALQIQINGLLATLQSLQAQLDVSASTSPPTGGFGQQVRTIATSFGQGSSGNNVAILQQFLISQNKGPSAQALASVGATAYFGSLTRAALAEFQTKVGISPALGYFGAITQAYVSAHY